MPRRAKPNAPTYDEVRQFRSLDELNHAIEVLKKRIHDVQSLRNDVRYDDQARFNVESALRETIRDIFGSNSPEFGEFGYHSIWHGPHLMGQTEQSSQLCFLAGIPQTATLLCGLIERLSEKRTTLMRDTGARSRSAFESMDLHSRIDLAAADLYRDTHYRQAVLDASIALVNYVKEKAHRSDLDGASLMRTAFSANNPVLAFNNLSDQADRDEQEGMMHLFEGAVLALRNPRAHVLFEDSPELALDYIGLLSLLAKRLDTAKRR